MVGNHKELEHNRKLFPDHLSSILHGALVGADSLWPTYTTKILPTHYVVGKA